MTNKKDEWGNIEVPGVSDEELYSKNWNKVRDSAKLVKDDNWKKQHREGIKNRTNDTWHKLVSEANKEKARKPEVREKHLQGLEKRNNSLEFKQKQKDNGLKRRKPIQVPWGVFDSRKAAVDYGNNNGIGNAMGKIQAGLKTNPTEYFYIDKK